LSENIDTTTSGGKLVFHVFGALAEPERDIIRERTMAGLVSELEVLADLADLSELEVLADLVDAGELGFR
jgi:hypothetical protein